MVARPVISRKEWIAAVAIAAAVSFFLLFPYVLGHLTAPDDTYFSGVLINIDDGTYLSAIEQGRKGAWRYRILFTPEAHNPIFVEGFYLTLGHVARLLGLTTIQMWHLARLILDFLLFLVLYRFISCFVEGIAKRQFAYLLAIFGGGYDLWRLPPVLERAGSLLAVPVDLRMPESHLFYSALTFPHFSAGITLILGLFLLVLYAWRMPERNRGRWLLAVGAGAVNLSMGIVYPFLIYMTAPVLGVTYLQIVRRSKVIPWKKARILAVAFAIPLPLYLYYAWALTGSEAFMAWSAQAGTRSPSPLHFLLAYLPYLLLAFLGLRKLGRNPKERSPGRYLLWTWVAVAAVLLYTPIDPQRRYVEGLQVPLAILAADGWYGVVLPWMLRRRVILRLLQRPRYSQPGLRRLLSTIFILLVSVSSIYLYSSAILTLSVAQPYPLFRPRAELEVMDWLRDHTSPSDLVFTSYWTGSYIPSKTGNVVFIGNRFETRAFTEKERIVERFFQKTTSDGWRVDLLAEYEVEYVFIGRAERAQGNYNPTESPFLELVYGNPEAAVYRVVQDG